jgi:hypothetical protein
MRFRTVKRSAGEICIGVGEEMFEIETRVVFEREYTVLAVRRENATDVAMESFALQLLSVKHCNFPAM